MSEQICGGSPRPSDSSQRLRVAPVRRNPRTQHPSLCAILIGLLWMPAAIAQEAERPPSPAPPVAFASHLAEPRGDVLLVVGAEGDPEYGAMFGAWAALWEAAARRGDCRFQLIGHLAGDPSTAVAKQNLQAALDEAAYDTARPLWVVLIGHGTFDGRSAKFNLLGEDLTAEELAAWLEPITRPIAVLQCASTSAPFLEAISGPGRVVISATKSGQEVNFARFGGFLAAALADQAADVDKDQQVSLLEAFLRASRLTADFYTGDNRLATEHAMLDDNGDRRGTRAAAFSGVRPVREADSGATLDGYLAHQWLLIPNPDLRPLPPHLEQRRSELEIAVLQLREHKAEFSEDEYYARLEAMLVELARIALTEDAPPATESSPEREESPPR